MFRLAGQSLRNPLRQRAPNALRVEVLGSCWRPQLWLSATAMADNKQLRSPGTEFSAARMSASIPLWSAKTNGQSCTVCDGKLHIGHAAMALCSLLAAAAPGPLALVLCSPPTVAWLGP